MGAIQKVGGMPRQEGKFPLFKSMARFFHLMKSRHLWTAFIYLFAAGIPAWQTSWHTQKEIGYFKQASDANDFQNNIIVDHPVIGSIAKIFIHNRHSPLPELKKAKKALAEMPALAKLEKGEKSAADFWSVFLLSVSLIYFFVTFATRKDARSNPLLFAITLISIIFFVVGITAPAMVIVVMSPENPIVQTFVIDYSTRSVLGVISELYSTNHWIIGVCLTLFSLIIPVTKAVLTVFAIASASLSTKLKIAKFLKLIGKWSMADVFVAAIILANFAFKADPSKPQTNLMLGFYYFLGYCLLSMAATELLHYKVEGASKLR